MVTTVRGSRRTAMEIVHSILSGCDTGCDNGGVNKTAIMDGNSLSYNQLDRYLSVLSDLHLIGRNQAGNFQITRMGRETLARVSNAVETLGDIRTDLKLSAPLV